MDTNPDNYLPCRFCHGYFQRSELWRDVYKCPFKEISEQDAATIVGEGNLYNGK